MAAFEVIALDTATPQLRAPGASDTYTFPRAVEMPLGTANGVLYLNGSKVVTSGSGLTFDGTNLGIGGAATAFGGAFVVSQTTGGAGGGGYSLQSSAGVVSQAAADSGAGVGYFGTRSNHPVVFTLNNAEQMRLTSTGLGIGTSSPGTKLEVTGDITQTWAASMDRFVGSKFSTTYELGLHFLESSRETRIVSKAADSTGKISFYTGVTPTEKMCLDSSGNLGLGVTPSNWGGAAGFLEMPNGRALAFAGINGVVSTNGYYDTGWKYKTTGAAAKYDQAVGAHQWYTAPSGTAGNAISFTQAMTLDASGNLGIGLSSPLVKLHIADPTSATVRVTSIGNANLDVTCSATQAIIGSPNGIPLLFNTSNTERLRLKPTGQLRYVPLAADPAGAEAGDVYYNSGTNKLRVYNGTAWVDLN